MPHLLKRPSWDLPERALTDEATWRSRRELLRALGLGAIGASLPGCGALGSAEAPVPSTWPVTLPEWERNATYRLGRELTDEGVAATWNNFYELSQDKGEVWRLAGALRTAPWTVEVTGDVARPRTFGLEDLLARFPLEERRYRFRCVEAWSMAVPWIGFPLRALLDLVQPLGKARYVRFVSASDPATMPGLRATPGWPWPYHEVLTLPEALHDLTVLAVGIYGHPLPAQHGAPIRLVVPWKYGFKSLKSLVRVELTAAQPPSFWNTLAPDEYDLVANVRPDRPHPRWSQATERILPTGQRVPTLMYNGYAAEVASLYGG